MKEQTISVLKVIAAAVVGILVGAAGVSVMTEPKVVVETKVVEHNITVPVETIVTKEVPVEVIKTVNVSVDNGKLDTVLQHIYDNSGNVEYLVEDLKDSEVAEIADRVVFINDVKSMAVDAVRSEAFDILDKEVVDGEELDDKDMEKLKVYSDDDKVIVSDVDFDDSDATVTVDVRFEQDDVLYDATFTVEVRDGAVEDVELDSVSLH
jgi:hypothetical protein